MARADIETAQRNDLYHLLPFPAICELFHDRADWSLATKAYVAEQGLDLKLVYAHAGICAVINCVFTGDGFFEFYDGGTPAFVIEVMGDDAATVVDLVAWPIDAPDIFATAIGDGHALGISNVTNPASWSFGRVLKVHRRPIDWLKSGCSGVVILDHRFVPYWLGNALGLLEAEDAEHARSLAGMLNPPRFDRSRILHRRATT